MPQSIHVLKDLQLCVLFSVLFKVKPQDSRCLEENVTFV